MTTRTLLLVLGIALLVIGFWIGITETSAEPVGDSIFSTYCGSPIHPRHSTAPPCIEAMGNKQLYTFLLMGAGVVLLLIRVTQKNSPLSPRQSPA